MGLSDHCSREGRLSLLDGTDHFRQYGLIHSFTEFSQVSTWPGILLHAGNMKVNKSKSSWSFHSSGEGSQYKKINTHASNVRSVLQKKLHKVGRQ